MDELLSVLAFRLRQRKERELYNIDNIITKWRHLNLLDYFWDVFLSKESTFLLWVCISASTFN